MQFEVPRISMRQELLTLAAAFEANFDSAPAWARVIRGSMVFASDTKLANPFDNNACF